MLCPFAPICNPAFQPLKALQQIRRAKGRNIPTFGAQRWHLEHLHPFPETRAHEQQRGHQPGGTSRAPAGWRRGPWEAGPGEPRGPRVPAPHEGAQPGRGRPCTSLGPCASPCAPRAAPGQQQTLWLRRQSDPQLLLKASACQGGGASPAPAGQRDQRETPRRKLPAGSWQVPRACPLVPPGPSCAGGSWPDIKLPGSPGCPRLPIRAAVNLTLTETGGAVASRGRTIPGRGTGDRRSSHRGRVRGHGLSRAWKSRIQRR